MIFGRKDRVGVSGRCRRVAVVLAVGMIVAEAEAEGESVEDSAMSFSVDESVSITLKGWFSCLLPSWFWFPFQFIEIQYLRRNQYEKKRTSLLILFPQDRRSHSTYHDAPKHSTTCVHRPACNPPLYQRRKSLPCKLTTFSAHFSNRRCNRSRWRH